MPLSQAEMVVEALKRDSSSEVELHVITEPGYSHCTAPSYLRKHKIT